MKAKTRYTIGWLLWFAAFLALEVPALANHVDGDTLSEHVWAWFHVLDPHPGLIFIAGRVLLGLGLLWLLFHFVMGWFTPSRPLPLTLEDPMTPTQTRHPWRATVRTVAAAGIALLSLLPVVASVAHVDTVPVVAQVLVVSGAVTRVLAIPGVDAWLRRYLPMLASSPAATTDGR